MKLGCFISMHFRLTPRRQLRKNVPVWSHLPHIFCSLVLLRYLQKIRLCVDSQYYFMGSVGTFNKKELCRRDSLGTDKGIRSLLQGWILSPSGLSGILYRYEVCLDYPFIHSSTYCKLASRLIRSGWRSTLCHIFI